MNRFRHIWCYLINFDHAYIIYIIHGEFVEYEEGSQYFLRELI